MTTSNWANETPLMAKTSDYARLAGDCVLCHQYGEGCRLEANDGRWGVICDECTSRIAALPHPVFKRIAMAQVYRELTGKDE